MLKYFFHILHMKYRDSFMIKVKELRHDTFGDSVPAINLADMLSQEAFAGKTRYVARFLNNYNTYFNAIISIPNTFGQKHPARGILEIIFKEGWEKLEEAPLPLKIKTHTMNIFNINYRKTLRKLT